MVEARAEGRRRKATRGRGRARRHAEVRSKEEHATHVAVMEQRAHWIDVATTPRAHDHRADVLVKAAEVWRRAGHLLLDNGDGNGGGGPRNQRRAGAQHRRDDYNADHRERDQILRSDPQGRTQSKAGVKPWWIQLRRFLRSGV